MNNQIENIKKQINMFLQNNADSLYVNISEGFDLFMVKSMIDYAFVIDNILSPFNQNKEGFNDYFLSMAEIINIKRGIAALTEGRIIAIYNNELWEIEGGSNQRHRQLNIPQRESSINGSGAAFVESTEINMNLIRYLYKNKDIITKGFDIGERGHTKALMVYDKATADTKIIEGLTKRMQNLDMKPLYQSTSELQQYLIRKQWLFPRLLSTERPDRVVRAIADGRVIILLDGVPQALIAPATFNEFMSSTDDEHLLPIPALFMLLLRYIAFVISAVAPAMYVIFTAYNPEMFRVQLALSVAGDRAGVPYPSYVEIIFMLLMMEFLTEASIRLPKAIGPTATTVGGLILGQAASQAHLVSNIMIIIVASVAICSFVLPIYEIGFALRILKYPILLSAILGGYFGFFIGFSSLVIYLYSMNSLDTRYIDPLGTFDISNTIHIFRRGSKK